MLTQFVITPETARELERRQQELQQKMAELQKEYAVVTQQLAAIPLFLASVNGEQQPVSGEAEAGRAQSRPDPMPTAGEISLPLAVKRALQEYGRMSAVEIREAVIRAGVPREKLGAGGSYLYTVLGRLDQRGHIERHRGRYFLVPGVAIEETK